MKNGLRGYLFAIGVISVTAFSGVTGAMAATPAVPTFGITTSAVKITDGWNRGPGGKVQATDGTNFYTVYTDDFGGGQRVAVVRSTDGGNTWERFKQVATSEFGLTGIATISLSNDAAVAGRQIVHVLWEQPVDTAWSDIGIYYSWADAADLNTWSAPVRVNESVPTIASWARSSISTTPNGKIHVIFAGQDSQLYYTSADNHDAAFSAPVALPGSPSGWEDIEATLDNAGNLHVAYPVTNADSTQFGLEYTMKPADSGTWKTPVTIAPLATTGQDEGFTSIAAYDANNLYVANHNWKDMNVYRSIDGGKTWRKSSVFAGTTTVAPTRHISVAVNSSNQVYVGTGFDVYTTTGEWLREEARIFKSIDGGRTWNTGSVIPNQTSVSIAFDKLGKAAVNLWGTNALEGTVYFTKQQ